VNVPIEDFVAAAAVMRPSQRGWSCDTRKRTTPPERNMIARRRCAKTGPSKSPASVCRCRPRQGSTSLFRFRPERFTGRYPSARTSAGKPPSPSSRKFRHKRRQLPSLLGSVPLTSASKVLVDGDHANRCYAQRRSCRPPWVLDLARGRSWRS
jgi:hypothetical protein